MVFATIGLLALAAVVLAGCGTYVPNLQEFPAKPGESALLVKAIVDSIHCEIKNALQAVISQDDALAAKHHQPRTAPWLDDWGIAGLLVLTIVEKSATNPSIAYTPNPLASLVFSLMGSANLSAQATRVENLNFFYSVRQLAYQEAPCTVVDDAYVDVGPHPPGSLLINSNLKIRDWLAEQILLVGTGATQVSLQKNALTYQVDFEVVSAAEINPMWKLARLVIGGDGTLLSASRDRTHSLTLTLGPADPTTKTLVGVAADQFFAQQIGSSLNSQLRNLVP